MSRVFEAGPALARHLVVEHAYVPLEQALPGLANAAGNYDAALAAFDGPDLRVHALLLDGEGGEPALMAEALRQALRSQEERIPGRLKAWVWVLVEDEARAKALRGPYLDYEDGHFLSKTLVGRGVLSLDGRASALAGRLRPQPDLATLAAALDPARAPDEASAKRQVALRQAQERQARRLLGGSATPLTWFLLGANGLAFGLQLMLAQSMEARGLAAAPAWEQAFVALGANDPALTLGRGQYWRLANACFLHGGLAHLAMNMLSLFSLGAITERLCGPWRFLLLYALAGLGASLLSAWLGTAGIPSLGASGAILGLAGALLAPRWRRDPRFPKELSDRLFSWLSGPVAAVFVLGFGLQALRLPVLLDNYAHLGGLLSGFALAYIYPPFLIRRTDRKV